RAATFSTAMTGIYKRRCPKTEVQPYAQKEVEGLTARRIFLRVPECAGGVESNLVLVIRGRASLYVMLYAWRPDPPTTRELQEGHALLNGVRVCDTAAGTCEALAQFTDSYKGGHTDQKILWERSMTAAREAIAGNRGADAEASLKDAVVEAGRLALDVTTLRATYLELAQLYRTLGRETDAVAAESRAAAPTATPATTTPSAAVPSAAG